MDLRSICVSNGTGIVLMVMLYYLSRSKILRQRTEDRVYQFMVVGVMLACGAEMLSYIIDGVLYPGTRLINFVVNTYLYTVNILLSFSVLVYVDLGIYGDPKRITKVYRPQIAVGAIMFLANVANLFVPVSFVITQNNVYERTPFSYVYYLVILYYCLTAGLLTRRFERENGAKAFFNIGVFLVPIMVGAGLQFLYYGLSLAWLSAAIGLTGLFMMQQNEVAYIDSLTGIYNRQYLSHIIAAWARREVTFGGLMVDVDHFKAINDSFGHSEGDKALVSVANILMDARTSGERVFRFAGDEFIVLGMAESADGLDEYAASLGKKLAEYNRSNPSRPLELSYGSSFFAGGNIDDFFGEMDKRMYVMKERHHLAEQGTRVEA